MGALPHPILPIFGQRPPIFRGVRPEGLEVPGENSTQDVSLPARLAAFLFGMGKLMAIRQNLQLRYEELSTR